MSILTDQTVTFPKLVDSVTGETITVDVSQLTLPERVNLHKMSVKIKKHATRLASVMRNNVNG